MFTFDNDAAAAQFASFATDWADKVVNDQLARVNSRTEHYASEGARIGSGRMRDYDDTPGSGRQSLAGFIKGARDILVDDMRAARRTPDDPTALFRVMLATALYARIGDAFTDIVVDADALRSADPLARPPMSAGTKRAATLRADRLSPSQQDAVLDAASNDPVRIASARDALKRMIADGGDSEIQIAAAVLGQIGDPLNRSKLNRLVEQIERMRWEGGGAPTSEAPPQASAAPPNRPPSIMPVASPSWQVVTSGGEDARRVLKSGVPDLDDPVALYGEDS